jgi:hypothetical protein
MAKCEYQIKVQKTPPSEQAGFKKLCMEARATALNGQAKLHLKSAFVGAFFGPDKG